MEEKRPLWGWDEGEHVVGVRIDSAIPAGGRLFYKFGNYSGTPFFGAKERIN